MHEDRWPSGVLRGRVDATSDKVLHYGIQHRIQLTYVMKHREHALYIEA